MLAPVAGAPAVHAAALGGGLAHLILRLFIWRAIWRLGLLVWHIPAVGPVILLLIVIAGAGLAIVRSRGGGPWGRRGWPRAGRRGPRYRPDGIRPGPGPRDW